MFFLLFLTFCIFIPPIHVLWAQEEARSPAIWEARPVGNINYLSFFIYLSQIVKEGRPLQQDKIDRINELARKARSPEGLTAQEAAEREALRREYIAAYRASLQSQLDNTYVLGPDGKKRKLQQRPKH